MAIDTTGGHSDMDYEAHRRTYKGFIRATVIVAAHLLVLLAAMAYFLV